MTFNEAVTKKSGNITIYNAQNGTIFETINVASNLISLGTDSKTVTIDLSKNLDFGTSYYVSIDQGTFQDVAANPYAGISSKTIWNFATKTAPLPPSPTAQFESGVFTTGQTGQVTIDYLFDGGLYEGELAIFSLDKMQELVSDTAAFIKEAARRSLSNSNLGHVVISDITEGAKLSGVLPGDGDFNQGTYKGAKSFSMASGEKFGFMLTPNGRIQQLFDNPTLSGSLRPLFSMVEPTGNFFSDKQMGLGVRNGDVFAVEDLWVRGQSDSDFNDIVFQMTGATGKAIQIDETIDPNREWRNTELGQQILSVGSTGALRLNLDSFSLLVNHGNPPLASTTGTKLP